MAFMHGAQDGQKFMGVFLLGVFLVQGRHFSDGICHSCLADDFVFGSHEGEHLHWRLSYY